MSQPSLDGKDTTTLNKKGWFLVTYFQYRKDTKAYESRDRVIEKANSIDRKAGIRIVDEENYIMIEVWECWKWVHGYTNMRCV